MKIVVAAVALSLLSGSAMASSPRFDLICRSSLAFGQERFTGTHPAAPPGSVTLRYSVDLGRMLYRADRPGRLGSLPIVEATAQDIVLVSQPGLTIIVRRTDGRYIQIQAQEDDSLAVFEGQCRRTRYTPF